MGVVVAVGTDSHPQSIVVEGKVVLAAGLGLGGSPLPTLPSNSLVVEEPPSRLLSVQVVLEQPESPRMAMEQQGLPVETPRSDLFCLPKVGMEGPVVPPMRLVPHLTPMSLGFRVVATSHL